MKKKFIALTITALMGITMLAGCGNDSGSTSNGDTIKIGGIGPTTGPAATYGISVKQGAELFVEEINAAGGINGKKVELIFEDDQADPNPAIQAFNKLVDNDKVVAILGATTSGSTLAIAPNATKKEIPLITPTGTAPDITKVGGEFTFRGCFIDSFQGETLAKYAQSNLKKQTAAVLYNAGSDYSKGIADSFKKEFEAKGGKITEFLTYNDKETDFNAQLTKIKGSNPDVLVLPDYYNVVNLIAKQARDKGITSQFLGGDGWESEELSKIDKASVTGSLYLNHYYSGDTSEQVKKFVENYKKKYNKEPDAFAALSYDSMMVIAKSIEKANSTDRKAIKEAMKGIEIDGVTGKLKFGEDRTAIKGATVIKVDGDKKVLVEKLNP